MFNVGVFLLVYVLLLRQTIWKVGLIKWKGINKLLIIATNCQLIIIKIKEKFYSSIFFINEQKDENNLNLDLKK